MPRLFWVVGTGSGRSLIAPTTVCAVALHNKNHMGARCGDAVEEARKMNEFDESVRNITRDGFHMSLDYGRYLTSLVMLKAFTGADVTKVEYEPCKTDKTINRALKEIANGTSAKIV